MTTTPQSSEDEPTTVRPLVWDPEEIQKRVSLVEAGDGEITLDGTLQMKLLEAGDTTAGRLAVGIATVQKGRNSGLQHRHQKHDEGFYVLSGRVEFSVEKETRVVGPGTFIMVPPGAPHGFHNPFDEEAVMFCTFSPSLYVGLFREMAEIMRKDPTQLGPVQEVARRYFTEFSEEYARPPID
ncbi:cupin domain-containing protein [Streptomyces sp. NPDC058457]|uniref:cupin domain-containing protein n=1 Tax=Streptomyces sp. NPDC058457 TaxID=3346507 RepID=UPI003649755E